MFFSSRQGSWRIWLVIGLGLCFYGYYEWSNLQAPNETELEQAVETQYRREVARMQEHAQRQDQAGDVSVQLSPEWESKFRAAIRNEHMAPVAKVKKRVQSTIGLGLIVMVLAAGMFVFERQAEKQRH